MVLNIPVKDQVIPEEKELHLAWKKKDFPKVLSLLQNPDIDPNKRINGTTLLLEAINNIKNFPLSKRNEVIEALLHHPKINVNARDSKGNFPLMRAVMNKDRFVVEKLLSKGVDTKATLNFRTAYDIASIHSSEIAKLLPSNKKINIPAQNWILSKMHSMKEPLDGKEIKEIFYGNKTGTCKGYSYMSMMAFLDEKRDKANNLVTFEKFKYRVNRIASIPPEIYREHMESLFARRQNIAENLADNPEKERLLQEAIENNFTLQEQEDLQLANLFDGIELCQAFSKHPELQDSERAVKSQNADAVLPLLATDSIEKAGGVTKAGCHVGVFKKKEYGQPDELAIYFEELQKEFKTLTFPISFQLSCNKHATAVHYDPVKNHWILVDANKSEDRETIITIKNTKDLAELVHAHYARKPVMSYSMITSKIYVSQKNISALQQKLDKVEKKWVFNEILKPTPEKIKALDSRGFSLERCAASAGKVDLVEEIVRNNNNQKGTPIDPKKINENEEKMKYYFSSPALREIKNCRDHYIKSKNWEGVKFLNETLFLIGQSTDTKPETVNAALFTCYARWQSQDRKMEPVINAIKEIGCNEVLNDLHKIDAILNQDNESYTQMRTLISDLRKANASIWTSKVYRPMIQAKMDFLIAVMTKAMDLAGQNAAAGISNGVLKEALNEVTTNLSEESLSVITQGSPSRTLALMQKIDPAIGNNRVTQNYKNQMQQMNSEPELLPIAPPLIQAKA